MGYFISKTKGVFSLILIFSCTLLGALFSPPETKLRGSMICFIVSSLIGYFIISPDIKSLYSALISKPNPNEANIKKSSFNFTIDYHNYLWHPSRIPIVIGAIWFIFVGSAQGNIRDSTTNIDQNTLFLLLPFLSFIGISGLITLLKGESVGKFREIKRGFWVYILGTISILIGWGMGLFLFLAYKFHL
jgi:hypothetical protein